MCYTYEYLLVVYSSIFLNDSLIPLRCLFYILAAKLSKLSYSVNLVLKYQYVYFRIHANI